VIKYIQVALHQVESVAFISLTQLRTIGARSIQKKKSKTFILQKDLFFASLSKYKKHHVAFEYQINKMHGICIWHLKKKRKI